MEGKSIVSRENNVRGIADTVKSSNKHVIESQEHNRGIEQKRTCVKNKEIVAENIPKLLINCKIQTQKAIQIPRSGQKQRISQLSTLQLSLYFPT